MAEKRGSKADTPYSPEPQIADLGKWPAMEEKIRERMRAYDLPPEEIELFLDEIRRARKEDGRTDSC